MKTPLPNVAEKISAFIDSTPLLGDRDALRERAAADGYLFFRQLLPKEAVLSVRRDLLEVLGRHGWLAGGGDDGAIDLAALNQVPDAAMRLDIGVSTAAYDDAQRLESVHRLPHHSNLLAFYRLFFGGEVLAHPRHIVRMITAHRAMVPTPQHQDFPLIQGAPETWTAWVPLGDCPRALGGLAVLRGSHQAGYLPILAAKGAGGLAVQTCPGEGGDWRGIDYEAGDVLTFSSLTVHRGTRCQWKERVRLSMDVRYQSAGAAVEAKSLQPHCDLSWDEIYAGWKQKDLQYYWRQEPQNVVPWDEGFLQPRRRIC
jgi:hypothetical protein